MSNKQNKGQKLYLRAKKIIPGGTMLLSKRPEMFLPDLWPSYFSKSKGCEVWDLDGKKYIDMSIMGIGTNTLGYGHDEVDNAVIKNIHKGNMSTLNCPEEVTFAEKLIEINPWADMVRLARTGGEANSIAIRIARVASGKDNIAICGYHGWHDWYLSANHNKKDKLGEHLLKGLSPKGVPKKLKDTVFPFHYNNFDELEKIVTNHDIGAIKLEVMRNFEPKNNFLQKTRDLATKNNIVLIFDECTSGFRETFGGIFKKFNVEPDIAIFGKTMGNGYAITAVVGKRNVMEDAQKTFISSTFWTERIGPTAGLKTLEIMEKIRSWEIVSEAGKQIRSEWIKLSKKYDIPITINGILPISTFSFQSPSNNLYKTLITQEMLKKGFLANTSFYACIDHTQNIIMKYSKELESIFYDISECEKTNKNIHDLLETESAHTGFDRLN